MIGQLVPFTAALCAGAGAWLLVAGVPGRGRSRALSSGGDPGAVVRPARRPVPRAPDGTTLRIVLGCLAVGALLSLWGRSPLPLPVAVLLAPAAVRWWRRRAAVRAAELLRDEVIAFCVGLAGEVRAGRPPAQAVVAIGTAGLGPPGGGVLAAARYGGDVPAALRAAARRPGADGLRGVAACWSVAVDGGASFAAGLERVAGALRAERHQHEELRAQLAGPRATAVVLATLPVFGLLLGAAMGVEPLRVLLGTPAGALCLAIGAALEWAGLAWVRAIVAAAERAGP
ncbi:type II secretion system F family protein [Streptomyces johnsoniae]|uniref:Type II secretion system F family protein n=1 Tax=Streptomyces johnsoniae TaxID=3075532 RepID=A0ABU2S8Y4_9ACTN|nr:type II secretion system F family protein [Streptomyces sp. DSM 41886]MDT0445393.1 type II secretion system F family protein [Streptomyces sp. DSM 41886]